tara:strand:- start:2035 stop:2160 length:126 start_codon:yes stop_codon:yes gene_type:complete
MAQPQQQQRYLNNMTQAQFKLFVKKVREQVKKSQKAAKEGV